MTKVTNDITPIIFERMPVDHFDEVPGLISEVGNECFKASKKLVN
jgi:hypothetical protein